MTKLLEFKNLSLRINKRTILSNLNFILNRGENLLITGKNGAGKSSLAKAIAGFRSDIKVGGDIIFEGHSLSDLSIVERARLGIFMSYQEPIEIPGLSYKEMLKENYRGDNFLLDIAQNLEKIGLNAFMADKTIGSKLSGGEKKKMELFQILMLRPKLIILDEIDSGLDTESAKQASAILSDYQKETGASFIIISHNLNILQNLQIDKKIELTK